MSDDLYRDSEYQTDTQLILCIEEHDNKRDRTSIDNRVFIGWSEEKGNYFVRGRRQDTMTSDFIPYALHCSYTDDLYDFLEFIVGRKGRKTIILYNFNNMVGMTDNELTYEFFERNININYEIAGYDNVKIKRKQIRNYLRILRNMYNDN